MMIGGMLQKVDGQIKSELNSLVYSLSSYISEMNNSLKEAKKRGELFNVFEILGVQTKETRLHSAFIVELLNPDGSHGLSIGPLKLFVEKLKNDICLNDSVLSDFKIGEANISVESEHNIGYINEDSTEGGRIDILINDGESYIAIENKIYAGDQDAQLVRYNNFLKRETERTGGKKLLLYLNLFGYLPSEISTTCLNGKSKLEFGKDYYCIGYNDFILDWLEGCRHLAIDNNTVGETIKQYIKTIKSLTGLNDIQKNKEMFFELLYENISAVCQITSNQDRLSDFLEHYDLKEFKDIAVEIIRNQDDLIRYLFKKNILCELKKWAKENDLECIDGEKPLGGKDYGVSFFKKDWGNKVLRIEFLAKPYSNAIIGICWKEKIKGCWGGKFDSLCITNQIWPNGFIGLKKYPAIMLADFANNQRINEILNYYKNQIDSLLKIIQTSPGKYNM